MNETDVRVLLLRVGRRFHVVDQSLIEAFSVAGRGDGPAPATLVSLSRLLGLQRDAAVDDRVLEVSHEGRPLGVQVTAVEGLRELAPHCLRPLPELVRRNCKSAAVLGLVTDLEGLDPKRGEDVIALDLKLLLTEQADKLPSRPGDSQAT